METKMQHVLNKDALFSDGTPYYRTPAEPKAGDKVTIRFRAQRNNTDEIYLVHEGKKQQMDVYRTAEGFDYYKTTVVMGKSVFRYHFEIRYGWTTCFYYAEGVCQNPQEQKELEIYPDFHIPEWARGAVMYQIYVDRFCNGDVSNDVETGEYFYLGDVSVRVTDWNKTPASMGVREFYGGDLQGVWDKLDYLKELGVEVLYLNPVFVSPSNHKYDCQDYEYIDPHYGKIVKDRGELLAAGDGDNAHASKYICRTTERENLEASNRFFAEFIAEVHRRGMKVILDGVFNHCGSFHKWMDRERIYENQEGYEKGAFVSADSPYGDYFYFYEENGWPYNPGYEGWWGHDTLPKLNYEASQKLWAHILEIGKKWVSPPFCADGWRLDVAADLGKSKEMNHRFWKDFRKAVKEANPQAVILAEHYGNPQEWLAGDEWDTVMNYDAFMEPVSWFLTGMEKHSDAYRADLDGNSEAFIGAMKTHMRALPMTSLYTAMNELSNHDHSRFLTRTNRRVGRISSVGSEAASENINPAVMRTAVTVQMTWPGSPTVYYGDEAGVCGFTDPDNRRTYPWGRENQEMLAFHKAVISIHKKYAFLRDSSLVFLWNDYQGLSYGRFSHEEQMIVVLNNLDKERKVEIAVWKTGISRFGEVPVKRILLSHKYGFTEEEAEYSVYGGSLTVHMLPYSVFVFYHRN
jgi:alpha-glucosidase